MARVLVLTDRHPLDFEWKGAFAWNLIRSLAESQHQVLALTTGDPGTIATTHPRLTIARPAKSWAVHHLPKFLKAILIFQPDVLLTISPKANPMWKGISLWPYLHGVSQVMPKVVRISALFENKDKVENPAAEQIVFTNVPFEIDLNYEEEIGNASPATPYVFVPAPISEWANPIQDLNVLREFLLRNSDLHARINGGWGNWSALERRTAWQTLMPVADRLQMLEPLTFPQMIAHARGSQNIWLESLSPNSWRDVISRFVAEGLGKAVPGSRPAFGKGSTANFLSRLFAGTLEPWPTP